MNEFNEFIDCSRNLDVISKACEAFNSPECAVKFAEELRKSSPSFAAFQNYLFRMIKNANTANLEKIIDEEEKSDYVE